MRKVKVQCTIGPACNNVNTLGEMLDAGMEVARVNLSHGSAESQKDKLENFRKAVSIRKAYGASIMFDIRGPEIRVKEIPGGELLLENGENVTLHCEDECTDDVSGYAEGIFVGNTLTINYENLCNEVKVGTEILIDDGKIRITVEDINEQDIICHVECGGTVKNRKSVNVPDVKLQMEYLRDDDKKDILWCIENGVDYVAGSFIRRVDDVEALRTFLDENGGMNVGIIAKIENKEALSNLEGIAQAANQVLVARGDLGVEIGFERVPAVQKRIIRRCSDMGRAVIVATQLIDSMTCSPVPTRAEVSDIANAVYDGATDLLVTGETAAGRYPAQVVKEMVRIIEQAEHDLTEYGGDIL